MRIFFIITVLFLYSLNGFTCTTFVLKNDSSLLFGRNLDWVSEGGIIVVNKRGIEKKALISPPEKPARWISKYGSVTFNQFGKEFPFGGINEKGLVVELMLVNGNYPPLKGKYAVNELQWVQYQLDNSKSIQEVIESTQKIGIQQINQHLHFLICDSLGNSAVIEFNNKEILTYKGSDLKTPVLENEQYLISVKKHSTNKTCRFGTAVKMINSFETQNNSKAVEYSFNILNKVKISGAWSIVYDIKNRQIHFKTGSNQAIRKVQIKSFNFSCKEPSLVYNIKNNDSGIITSLFSRYTEKVNNEIFTGSLRSNKIGLPSQVLHQFSSYNTSCICID
jgi:penicillin V acylase-like amidase (Ntn superfamily)